MIRVAFRVDGDARIGTGHVMRCLTLADALAEDGVRCTFVSRHLSDGLASLVLAGHALRRLAGGPPPRRGIYDEWLGTTMRHDAAATCDAVPDDVDLLVVDHYALGADWEAAVTRPSRRLIAMDDLRRRHACDLVMDTGFGTVAEDYADRVGRARVLTGVEHALLRPGFARARGVEVNAGSERASVPRVLISMGGADRDDWSARLCAALAAPVSRAGWQLHVVTGAAYPHRQRLVERFGDRVGIHHRVTDMPGLLASMHLCVGATGASAWERCCLGLPSVGVVLADNQRSIHARLVAAGAIVDGGRLDTEGEERAVREVRRLVGDAAGRQRLAQISRGIVDGFGVWRVKGTLLRPLLERASVRLREARADDTVRLFDWQRFPDTRRFAGTPRAPSWHEHEAWMADRLKGDGLHVAEARGVAVGTVRLDEPGDAPALPDRSPAAVVSIAIAPGLHGMGLGRRVLDALRTRYPDRNLIARVLAGNAPSLRLFEGAGFVRYAPEHLVLRAGPVA